VDKKANQCADLIRKKPVEKNDLDK
jgi:hypothetical protein